MGKSSKDKRDAYYRLAKEQSWRARSAFKLIHLDEQFDLFAGCTRVVDLCAAPGSWSQVLSRVLVKGEGFGRRAWVEKREREQDIIWGKGKEEEEEKDKGSAEATEGALQAGEEAAKQEAAQTRTPPVRIVAVDLQPMSPLEGITQLVGDITHPSTILRILAALDPPTPSSASPSSPTTSPPPSAPAPAEHKQNPVDLVLSDGAPDVTGLHDLDIYIQSQLLTSALDLTLRILKPGGKFVAKIFRGKNCDLLYAQLRILFEKVSVAKPRSSRASSLEAFVVCEGFRGVPAGHVLGEIGRGPLIQRTGKGTKREKGERTGFVDGQKRTARGDGVTVVELEGESEEEDDYDDDDDDGEQGNKGDPVVASRRWIAPFIACGDLSAWDADATHHLPKDRVSLDPVQPPTAPPYKRALEERRKRGGLYGKTSKT